MRKARQRSAARISAFIEGMRDDLGAPPLLTEQPLEHVGGADRPPMRGWETQMGNARFKVVLQTCQYRRQGRAIGRHHVVAQQARERRRGGLVAGNGARHELRPLILRHLALQIAQLVGETALPRAKYGSSMYSKYTN